jgi:lipopolysaccharide/colanic/teichoic acid biosynthesis glycosyltransferase
MLANHSPDLRESPVEAADASLDRALARLAAARKEERTAIRLASRVTRLRGVILLVLVTGLLAGLITAFAPARAAGVSAALGFLAGIAAGLAVSQILGDGGRPLTWRTISSAVKRAADVLLAGLLLVVVAPSLLLIALALRLENPKQPVLVHDPRIGRHGRVFPLYRFRTASRPESTGTGIGRWLRRSSLEQLPELYNVVRGDLSLVGPRPRKVSEYLAGLTQPPYITPGMVSLVDLEAVATMDRADDLDRAYADSWSLRQDVLILLKAIGAAFR